MTERHATFLICDEVLISLNGKFLISGMYPGDLVIPAEPTQLAQLVVFVQVETPIDKPFHSLAVHVQLPGDPVPRVLDASTTLDLSQGSPMPNRTTLRARLPFLIPQPLLRSGPIEVTIVHGDGQFSAGRQWVLTTAQLQEAQANALAATQTKR